MPGDLYAGVASYKSLVGSELVQPMSWAELGEQDARFVYDLRLLNVAVNEVRAARRDSSDGG